MIEFKKTENGNYSYNSEWGRGTIFKTKDEYDYPIGWNWVVDSPLGNYWGSEQTTKENAADDLRLFLKDKYSMKVEIGFPDVE